MIDDIKLTENYIKNKTIEYLINKENGQWHLDKADIAELRQHGPDIVIRGGKLNSEFFIIEVKGKSYAKSANSINKEEWLNALGQLITRMNVSRTIKSGKTKGSPNRAYKYGLALPEIGANVALRRIPREIAKTLNLHIFSCDDNGNITMYTPKDFK